MDEMKNSDKLCQEEVARLRQVWLDELKDDNEAIFNELMKPDDAYHSKKYLREKFDGIVHNLNVVKRIIEFED